MKRKILLLSVTSLLIIGSLVILKSSEKSEKLVVSKTTNTNLIKEAIEVNSKKIPIIETKKVKKIVKKEKTQNIVKDKVVDVFKSYRRVKEPIEIVDAHEAKDFLAKKLNLSVDDVKYQESRLGTNGSTYFKYTQEYKGLKVYGSNFTVQVSKNKTLEAIIAKYAKDINIDIKPSIGGEISLNNVLQDIADTKQKIFKNPRLIIYVDYDNNPFLAYSSVVKYIDKKGTQQIRKIFINAKDGALLNTTSRLYALKVYYVSKRI